MPRSKIKASLALLGAGACLYALTIPAFGQGAPESLLPEGFNDPVPPPPPPPAVAPAPSAPSPSARPAPAPRADRDDGDLGDEEDFDELDELGIGELLEEIPPEYELPPSARRSLDRVGPLTPNIGGYGETAFDGYDGRYLEILMRRLYAPGPSRWQHISLRRAVLSHIPTPSSVSAPDWIAERAWLLLRMGEVDGARLLVERVDSDRYTPKLYAVAMQVALANGDLAAFCPLVAGARRAAETPAWVMADAICAGLAGESARATSQMTAARRAGITNGFDLLLGERAANAGTSAQAVRINWEGVERLNAWRFGISAATSEDIPEELFANSGRQVAAWRARMPTIDLADRMGSARTAAVTGVFSNETLVTMYSALLPAIDPGELSSSPTGLLRAAYVRDSVGGRIEAMQALWAEGETPDDRYAGLITTARAAARIAPQQALAGEAGDLIASMLTAGLDTHAARWANVVNEADEGAVDQAWAMLAVGAPGTVVEADLDRIEAYAGRAGAEGAHRARLLAAALAGLGRLDADEARQADADMNLGLRRQNIWTRQLERAARSRRQGAVALLAAVGMQVRDWRSVPPSHLYHIVRAYRLAGLEPEARMIAAEAITRA